MRAGKCDIFATLEAVVFNAIIIKLCVDMVEVTAMFNLFRHSVYID
jgi:hypothetical protein